MRPGRPDGWTCAVWDGNPGFARSGPDGRGRSPGGNGSHPSGMHLNPRYAGAVGQDCAAVPLAAPPNLNIQMEATAAKARDNPQFASKSSNPPNKGKVSITCR